MTITLILLVAWILILNAKSLKARWLYVLIITVVFFLSLNLWYIDEDWTGY
ncbi:hypothetical protein E8L90_06385 [Brevibacillus antibioticus]|uniref:Uncharacterized protein n=1 Tax=Brevibacillus antibioticus TaxID=2570228 RepID=A0A4U2Y4S7_9BACL|nr:hypothetical protein E8L90_06385 [Brevibacillus antibioticus]